LYTVLVTGGAGYIGSHTAKLLAGHGVSLIVLDNLSTGHRWAAKWGRFVEGDLGDTAGLNAMFRSDRIDAVVHFAAKCYVGESAAEPRTYFRNNVVNTVNLLDAMLEAGVKQFVFSSSCAIYGIPSRIPITEDTLPFPVNPYGETKLAVERILRWYREAYGLRWAALRYFNAAGADIEGDLGEEHSPETHLIPLAIEAALGHRPAMEIYGTDYPTADGTAVRDYIHVADLACAHVLALEHLHRSGESVALNLGTGSGYSVKQIISAVETITGKKVPTLAGQRRPGDPPVLIAETGKAARVLGWQARYSSLETIIETAWRWHSRMTVTAA